MDMCAISQLKDFDSRACPVRMEAIEWLCDTRLARREHRRLPSALRHTTHEYSLPTALREVYLLLWERRCADWIGLGQYAVRYHRRLMRTALWLLSNLLYEAAWGFDRSDLEERDMADDTPGSLFGLDDEYR